MSGTMSIEDIEKVVKLAVSPVLIKMDTQQKSFDEFKAEVYRAQKDINQAIINQQVDRRDFENHKEDNKKDIDTIKGSLTKNWNETRVLMARDNKWSGIGVAVSFGMSVAAILFTAYKTFK